MRAIETIYKGWRFRSRTEARWAVFFDALGFRWEYEPEGFEFHDGTRYLPDFWLPEWGVWIEVKGREPSPEELRRAELLHLHSGRPVLVVTGVPGEQDTSTLVWAYRSISGDISPGQSDTVRPLWAATSAEGMTFLAPGLSCENGVGVRIVRTSFLSKSTPDDRFERAIHAARSARFEHGESGAVR